MLAICHEKTQCAGVAGPVPWGPLVGREEPRASRYGENRGDHAVWVGRGLSVPRVTRATVFIQHREGVPDDGGEVVGTSIGRCTDPRGHGEGGGPFVPREGAARERLMGEGDRR